MTNTSNRDSGVRQRVCAKPASIACSDRGRVRARNEDAFYANDDLGLFAVADGVGGCKAGHVASAMAMRAVERVVERRRQLLADVASGATEPRTLIKLARHAAQVANRHIRHRSRMRAELRGMASTLTFLIVAGRHAVMGHLGDSRLYRLRAGQLEQLSEDHNGAQVLVGMGVIDRAQARVHPYSSLLTNSLGTKDYVVAEARLLEVEPGDRFLLCTDGLSGFIPDDDWMASALTSGRSADAALEQLIGDAIALRSNDNVTGVIVDMLRPCRTRGGASRRVA